MLNEHETIWLAGELAATAEALGQVIGDNAAALMAADLSVFPQQQLRMALGRVRKECAGKLTLKAILDQLDALQGRLGGNEAWALALLARDERETVVWTDEIAQAWAVAAPMATGRDLVGARMAFKDAYDRITQRSRESLKSPAPAIAVGWDKAKRIAVVAAAHNEGRIALALAMSVVHEGEVELAGGALSLSRALALANESPAARIGGALVPIAASSGPQVGYDKATGKPFKISTPANEVVKLISGEAMDTSGAPAEFATRLRAVRNELALRAQATSRRNQAASRLARMQQRQRKLQVDRLVQERMRAEQAKP